MSKWPYTGPSVIWSIPDEAERFDRLLDEVHRAYGSRERLETGRLIEHTVEILGALDPAADGHQREIRLAATYLRAAWLELERRWQEASLLNYGEAIGRKRPKNWRASRYRKHRTLGPLVFAEISFELSAGYSRTAATTKLRRKYPVAKTQLDEWYDTHAAEMRSAVRDIPVHITEAFLRVAEVRKLTVVDAISEVMAARLRAESARTKGVRVKLTTDGDTVRAEVTPSRLPKKSRKSPGRSKPH